jgi:hypothetical protein
MFSKMNKVFLLFFIAFSVSCGTYPYVYRYDAGNESFKNRKVAVVPLNVFVENDFSKSERIKQLVNDSLYARLVKNNFEVVDPIKVSELADTLKNKMGGFFNSNTGEIDTLKTKKFRMLLIDSLVKRYNVSGVLFPSFIFLSAAFSNYTIRWHGRSYVIRSGSTYGRMGVMSLYVRLYDRQYKMVFDNAGGIQPIDKITFKGFVRIDADDILRDIRDLSKALEIIFKPLQQKRT